MHASRVRRVRRKTFLPVAAVTALTVIVAGIVALGQNDKPFEPKSAIASAPQVFVENAGYLDGDIDFFVRGGNRSIFLNATGFSFQEITDEGGAVTRLVFDGANAVHPQSLVPSPATISFFSGSPDEWRTLNASEQIIYRDLWDGISLTVSATQEQLKYTYDVAPGVDPSLIRMHYEGADVSLINDREISVTTSVGQHVDAAPESFQTIDGRKVDVSLAYDFDDAHDSYGFLVGKYDKSKRLVIDPVILYFATYFGSTVFDAIWDMKVDATGIYGAGSSDGTIPTSVGPFTTKPGVTDGIVIKLNPAGTALIYAGYIGGTDGEAIRAIDIDSSGNAYVVGITFSDALTEGFPTTVGPSLTHGGTVGDFVNGFVCKVNSTGTSLPYCGYISGANQVWGEGVAVDSSNRAIVVGNTSSSQTTFPDGDPNANDTIDVSTFDGTFNGAEDAFAVRVSATGAGFEYAGFVGGSGTDKNPNVVVDSAGNAYVGGRTASTQTTFPDGDPDLDDAFEVPGFDQTHNGGADVFAVKINTLGSALSYATFIGGSSNDGNADPSEGIITIGLDSSNQLVIVTRTASTQGTFPDGDGFGSIPGYDQTYNGGAHDGVFAKLDAAGTSMLFASYTGGSGDETAYLSGLDDAANIYISGRTDSTQATFPVANGPDSTYNGGVQDGFVQKFSTSGLTLEYSGFVGGSGDDNALGGAVLPNGTAYISGATDSGPSTFPDGDGFGVVPGYSQVLGGDYDGFIAQITAGGIASVTLTGDVAQSITFTLSDNTIGFGDLSANLTRCANGAGTGYNYAAGCTTAGEANQIVVTTNAAAGLVTTFTGGPLRIGVSGPTITSAPYADTSFVTGVGTEQFGIQLAQVGSPVVPCTRAGPVDGDSVDEFAWGADSSAQIAITAPGPCNSTTFDVRHAANISSLTEAGAYTLTATWVTTGTF